MHDPVILSWFQPAPTIVLQWVGPEDELEDGTPISDLAPVAVIVGPPGPPSLDIFVSATAPIAPQLNDLWIDIS